MITRSKDRIDHAHLPRESVKAVASAAEVPTEVAHHDALGCGAHLVPPARAAAIRAVVGLQQPELVALGARREPVGPALRVGLVQQLGGEHAALDAKPRLKLKRDDAVGMLAAKQTPT
eukprot:938570-Pleurochrysis_carterae.AAC.2